MRSVIIRLRTHCCNLKGDRDVSLVVRPPLKETKHPIQSKGWQLKRIVSPYCLKSSIEAFTQNLFF